MGKHAAEIMAPKFRTARVYPQYMEWANTNLLGMDKVEAEARMAKVWYARSMNNRSMHCVSFYPGENGFYDIDIMAVMSIKPKTVAKYIRLLSYCA